MLAHAVCRVALLQEPRSIAIQRRTDDWQRCVATVKLGKQIKQHRVLSFPGAATCTRANDANNCRWGLGAEGTHSGSPVDETRSEEHTSELQSRRDLVCR